MILAPRSAEETTASFFRPRTPSTGAMSGHSDLAVVGH
jgi:hypothetical protein